MGSLEIKLKHEKSDFFKEHFEEVLELIKSRRLSYRFDPGYKEGLFQPVTLERVSGHLSIILVDIDYSKLFETYRKSSKDFSKLVATVDFFKKEPDSNTEVFEFLDNGFLEKIGIYADDWRKSGFRWSDDELYTHVGDDIIYDIFDQNNVTHQVNLAYKLAEEIAFHLKARRNHPNTLHGERDLLQEYLGYLQPIIDPNTLKAYKKYKNSF
ncbi:MAG: hypothetical protein Q8Q01_04040 [archaeon]|nr:hypothetical protein [archaeon]